MIKKTVRSLCILILIVIAIVMFTGCDNKNSSKDTDQSQYQGKSFLWEVTAVEQGVSLNKSKGRVFLLGSIHVANDTFYPLDPIIEKSFDQSDCLVVEVNTLNSSPQASTAALMKYGLYKEGKTLKKEVPNELYTRLEHAFKSYGASITLFNVYKPWVVYTQLSNLQMMQQGFDSQKGIDMHFLKKANKHKTILELETMEFQFEMLASFDDDMQEMLLESTVDSLEKVDQNSMEGMANAWKAGDTQAMEALIFEELRADSSLLPFYDKMFFERNRAMADKIEQYLNDDKTYFVIAGAGHMIGDQGIIALLEAKGYELEQH